MFIKRVRGYELEKERPNTSEDFFNRSEVDFIDNGEGKTFYLLYVRYFDEIFNEFTPYEKDPLFVVNGEEIYFKDIAGLICLLKNPAYRNRKRVYINTIQEFEQCFKGINFEKLPEVFKSILEGGYELKSSINLMEQPSK